MFLRKRITTALLLVLVAGLGITPVLAQEAYTLTARDGRLSSSLQIYQETALVSEDVDNDVVALAGEVVIDAQVADGVYLAAGNVLINGNVGGDVLIAAGNVVINGNIEGDVRIVAGQVFINSERIGGELVIPGAGLVSIADGVVIEGRSQITAGTLTDRATNNPQDLAGFADAGYFRGPHMSFDTLGPVLSSVAQGFIFIAALFTILFVIGLFITSYSIIRLFPVLTERTLETMKQKPGKSVLVGAVVMLLSPFLALFLVLTVVGMPLLGLLILLASLVWIFANVYANYLVGRLFLKKLGMNKTGRALPLLLGTILMSILGLVFGIVPLLGSMFNFFVTAWGSGAILLDKWHKLNGRDLLAK